MLFWKRIFQSTHPRRVRRIQQKEMLSQKYFNPRTREGCDVVFSFQTCRELDFNPRTREGCDRDGASEKDIRQEFQSTHPRRVRQWNVCLKSLRLNFNPRTREGCDEIPIQQTTMGENFNPRTREGCDFYSYVFQIHILLFQSTHPRRVRLC